jgi:hypothetical protein
MNVSEVFRRVQAITGDRGEVLIRKADMIDWINDAIDEIIRETHHGEISQTFPASTGFISITSFEGLHGSMPVKRVTYDGMALEPISLEDLDAKAYTLTNVGSPLMYYIRDATIRFYPTPAVNDAKSIVVTLSDFKAALTTPGSDATAIPLPIAWHSAVVDYVTSKAHEKNQDWDAANRSMGMFKEATGQRIHQSNAISDSYPVIRDDPNDWL